jgi:hypothetical protein
LFLGLVLVLFVVSPASAQGKSVTIPKGTKVQKLGPGNFKLTTPSGTVFSITAYKKPGNAQAGAILGDCGIYDAKGKLVATGGNAILKGGPTALAGGPGKALKDIPATEYIKIDDEVTWLPATIQFPSIRVFDHLEFQKLSPQPDPPGKVR